MCFAECTVKGAEALLSKGRFAPWALALPKQLVYSQSGGPVFYVRDDEWPKHGSISDQMRARVVRYSPVGTGGGPSGYSDWTHEREWRCLQDVRFGRQDVMFAVVPTDAVLPSCLSGIPLVRFDLRAGRLMDPSKRWSW